MKKQNSARPPTSGGTLRLSKKSRSAWAGGFGRAIQARCGPLPPAAGDGGGRQQGLPTHTSGMSGGCPARPRAPPAAPTPRHPPDPPGSWGTTRPPLPADTAVAAGSIGGGRRHRRSRLLDDLHRLATRVRGRDGTRRGGRRAGVAPSLGPSRPRGRPQSPLPRPHPPPRRRRWYHPDIYSARHAPPRPPPRSPPRPMPLARGFPLPRSRGDGSHDGDGCDKGDRLPRRPARPLNRGALVSVTVTAAAAGGGGMAHSDGARQPPTYAASMPTCRVQVVDIAGSTEANFLGGALLGSLHEREGPTLAAKVSWRRSWNCIAPPPPGCRRDGRGWCATV